MSNIFLDAYASLETLKNKREYERNLKLAKNTIYSVYALGQKNYNGPVNPDPRLFPNIENRINQFIAAVPKLPRDCSVNFGDSLTDFQRKMLSDSIDGIFSIAGSWHVHMAYVAERLAPYLKFKNVEYVIVGTLGGNPFLFGEHLKETLQYSKQALDKIRSTYKNAKIIVYMPPPVFAINVNNNILPFELGIYDWIQQDNNAVMIELHKELSWLPISEFSSDGVHLTDRGARILSKLIDKAKKAFPKTIISKL